MIRRMQRDPRSRNPLFYNFEEVARLFRPMGRNQVYSAFKNDEIAGGLRIGGRWYAVKKIFDRKYRGEAAERRPAPAMPVPRDDAAQVEGVDLGSSLNAKRRAGRVARGT